MRFMFQIGYKFTLLGDIRPALLAPRSESFTARVHEFQLCVA